MSPHPQTAAPSPGDAEAFFRSLFDEGAEHIISLHVPANLSGTLNAMRLGAEFAAGQITLVDSLQLTFGIGMQVWAAAQLAAEGASVADILAAIERVRRHTQVLCHHRHAGIPAAQRTRQHAGVQPGQPAAHQAYHQRARWRNRHRWRACAPGSEPKSDCEN